MTAFRSSMCRSIAGRMNLAGLGAFGEWNVGNWCEDVQSTWIKQDL